MFPSWILGFGEKGQKTVREEASKGEGREFDPSNKKIMCTPLKMSINFRAEYYSKRRWWV